MKALLGLLLFCVPQLVLAKDPYPRNINTDVIHYIFTIQLNNTDQTIKGEALIRVRMTSPETNLVLDLIEVSDGAGMKVDSVVSDGKTLRHVHQKDKLTIQCPGYQSEDTTISLNVFYQGQPKDGLIISTNKFGNKSFFGDNWPDRGRNWLPCVDHVSDKATVEFKVIAPSEYKVVANGYRKAEYPYSNDMSLTHYVSNVALPTKVMVIGVSHFSVQTAGFSAGIPIETWVYPENQPEGFLDYQPAVEIVDYFSTRIGPFAFEKLANVQSKTVYGGMENSGAIFYYEGSVKGTNKLHSLLAHEIAHQWFGDAVTEKDWHHIWLSEGFATYLEAVYMSEHLNFSQLGEKMRTSRDRVVSYYYRNPNPVIDTTITNFRRLLSTNSYQKGAWVLHMLRNKLGDEAFWSGIQVYYERYKNGSALTSDFRHCMEEASHENLQEFFTQWLYLPGHPKLDTKFINSGMDNSGKFTVIQVQESNAFKFELEVVFTGEDNKALRQVFLVDKKNQSFDVNPEFSITEYIIDPDVKLLFESGEKNLTK
jgi:aminopeptidase N